MTLFGAQCEKGSEFPTTDWRNLTILTEFCACAPMLWPYGEWSSWNFRTGQLTIRMPRSNPRPSCSVRLSANQKRSGEKRQCLARLTIGQLALMECYRRPGRSTQRVCQFGDSLRWHSKPFCKQLLLKELVSFDRTYERSATSSSPDRTDVRPDSIRSDSKRLFHWHSAEPLW